jgi:hypothetical protein
MKISEIIGRLLDIGKNHGDLEVKIESSLEDDWGDISVSEVDILEFDYAKYIKLS